MHFRLLHEAKFWTVWKSLQLSRFLCCPPDCWKERELAKSKRRFSLFPLFSPAFWTSYFTNDITPSPIPDLTTQLQLSLILCGTRLSSDFSAFVSSSVNTFCDFSKEVACLEGIFCRFVFYFFISWMLDQFFGIDLMEICLDAWKCEGNE